MSASMNCRRFHTHDSAAQSSSSLQSTLQRTWRPAYPGGGSGPGLLPGLVLNWIESEKDLLIFKGGTALKRCHFGEYRFSEDLDFTLQRKAEFAEIREGLEEVYELVAQASGIRFAFEGEDRQAHVNSYTFYLRCQGPLPTTRSRVSFFMNRFRELGFIEYNGRIKVHKSPLNAVLLDRLPEVGPERPVSSTTARTRSKPTRRL